MQYKILKEERMPPYQRSLDIETPNQLNFSEIRLITNQLLDFNFDLTFLVFYTSKMEIDKGGYSWVSILKENKQVVLEGNRRSENYSIRLDYLIDEV